MKVEIHPEKNLEGLEYAWEYIRERPNPRAVPKAMAMSSVRAAIDYLRGPAEVELEGGGSSWWHVCGECRGIIDTDDKYCKHCGRKLAQYD